MLYQRIREAEREKIWNEYKDKVGEVVNGTVRRFERGDIIVDLGGVEAVVPRNEQSRHERYSQGERIRGVIIDVHTQPKGPQIVLSRTDPRLLVKLFEMEVPEIYDGTVVIKTAVRAPGERAKVAVYSRERDVDPVGACVGMKGSRVQSIIRELRGEKIDIIEHSDDLVTFAQSALAPAKITRVSVTHHGEVPHLDVIVEDEQLSLAIGKRGQNVRLASELLNCKIDVKSESDVKDEVAGALARMLQGEMRAAGRRAALDWSDAPVSAAVVDRLVAVGLDTVDALLDATPEQLQEIHGVDAGRGRVAARVGRGQARRRGGGGPRPQRVQRERSRRRAESSTMGDQDFMAALNKAFQETEPSTPAADAERSRPTNPTPPARETDGDEEEKEQLALDRV